jgi:murein DD-endopeptidase MepM/ murein hydrolase activator NlpD
MRLLLIGLGLIMSLGLISPNPGYNLEDRQLLTYRLAYEKSQDEIESLKAIISVYQSQSIEIGKVLDTMRVSSPFGIRRETHIHKGVDLAVPIGTPIYAPHDGIISEPKYDSSSGWYNHLDHPKMKSKFLHLKHPMIPGPVKKGQIIGITGNTGRSSGPHLHWEIWIGGVPVNPMLL